MNWNFLITFAVGVGLYVLCVLVYGFFKKRRNKNKIKKDDKEHSEVVNDEKRSDKE